MYMADVHSKGIRSYNMSRILSKNTKAEIAVRKFLHKNGFRYRLNVKRLPGKPDIVLKKYRTVIFVHGCFWHGHTDCKDFVIPKSNQQYWIPKIEKNLARDKEVKEQIESLGWNIIIVWECQLKKRDSSGLESLKTKLLGTNI
jgi:DNA mismatch endonuclease (patch repair protein)